MMLHLLNISISHMIAKRSRLDSSVCQSFASRLLSCDPRETARSKTSSRIDHHRLMKNLSVETSNLEEPSTGRYPVDIIR